MTAAWVDSMPITISDDDDDDDNEVSAPDNQPSNDTRPAAEPAEPSNDTHPAAESAEPSNDTHPASDSAEPSKVKCPAFESATPINTTHPAAESAACDADQPSSLTSDAVPQTSDAAKTLVAAEFSSGTSPDELHTVEHSYAMDTTPTAENPTSDNGETSSVGMLPDDTVNDELPARVSENTDDLKHVDSPTAESVDVGMTTSAAEVPAAELIDIGTKSHDAESIPVMDGGPHVSPSSEMKNEDGKTESSTVEGDPVFTSGMSFYCFSSYCFETLCNRSSDQLDP